jgi:beta-lactamase regulating signal transducer with metallopeptidase domain
MQTIGFKAFQGVSGRLVGLGLLHSLWMGLFVASVVALALQAFSRLSHQTRHFILLMALFLVATAPVVATLLHHALASRPMRKAPQSEPNFIVSGLGNSPELPFASDRGPIHSVVRTKAHRARFHSIMSPAISQLVTAVHRYQSILVAAWTIGMLAIGGILALGSRAVHRICREARPAPAAIRERAARLARRERLRKPPRVMVHPGLHEPCLGGLCWPVILLPEAWLDCREGELIDAILAHELAHARRLDHLVNPAQRLVESTFFFNPAVHWLSRSLRRQREFCADALAVRLTRDPLALAQALESVARLRLAFPDRLAVGSALGGQSVSLLPRIQELLGMTPTRPRKRLWPFAALPAAGLIALITAASGLSQEKPIADRQEAPLTIAQNGRSDKFQVSAPSQPVTRYGPLPIAPAPADFDRQICYEIRYLSLDANPWREAVKDHLKLIKQEADVCAWLIDDKSILDLFLGQKDTAYSVIQAPTVTTFENAHALISNMGMQKYVSQVEKVETADHLRFRPIVKEFEVGIRIDVVGSMKAGGTAVVVDVHDSSLLNLHTLVRRETFHDHTYAAQYQVPTAIERSCRVSCEVPDSGSLLISMGLHERRGRLSNAGEAASGLLEAVGLPPVPARPVICEWLVMIKPRRIVLEAEKPQITGIKGGFDGRTR